MTSRRRAVTLAAGAFAVSIAPCFAQAPSPSRRVGILLRSSAATVADAIAAFRRKLSDLGWSEGRDIEYRVASADGQADRVDAMVTDMVAWRPEVVVVAHVSWVHALQRVTSSLPIVLAGAAGATESGSAISLARPGGQVTGVTNQGPAAVGKLVDFASELVPRARRIAVLLNPDNPINDSFVASIETVCAKLKIEPVRIHARSPAEYREGAARIVRENVQAVIVVTDPQVIAWRRELSESLQTTRLPVLYSYRENVEVGGLLSYGAPFSGMFELAAWYVDRILRGARPHELPVQQPLTFSMVVNLREAKRIGLKVPQSILIRADEIIE
jgi:putative ABC transport system substrate-binding protein